MKARGVAIIAGSLLFLALCGPALGASYPECNERGIPNAKTGKCDCAFGYFGDDCTLSPVTQQPSRGVWILVQVIQISLYCALSIAAVLGLFSTPRKQKTRLFFFISMLIIGVGGALRMIDFYSFYFIFPFPLSAVLYLSVSLFEFPAYLLVLFHWIEVYHISVRMLRDVELLKKVNSMFTKDVTVEEVTRRAYNLTKLRIPFIIITLIGWILEIVQAAAVAALHSTFGPIQIVASVYAAIAKLGICLGFILYSRRLMKVMPVQHFERMNRISRTTIISSTILVCNWLAVVLCALLLTDPLTYSIGYLIVITIATSNNFIMMAVFVRPSKRFPWLFSSTDNTEFVEGNNVTPNNGHIDPSSAQSSPSSCEREDN